MMTLKRTHCAAILGLCIALLPTLAPALVRFTRDDNRYELLAENATANEILTVMEDSLQIPVGRLPGNTPPRSVHTKSSDLEKVLASFCESFVVLYAEDETGTSLPAAIQVTVSVDTPRPESETRGKTIQSHQLEQRLPIPDTALTEYAGIGAYIQPAEDGSGLWLRPVSENSPAARCGIQLGDKVLTINGRAVQDFPNINAMAEAIRGPIGSPVQLLIQKPDGSLINQVVMRDLITSP
ncbi:MAG: PDZ domain-containing protein [Kiritimatiellae bacterium]|nr:PDZ domain-containing protein [Kiritimatiellia bacterium]